MPASEQQRQAALLKALLGRDPGAAPAHIPVDPRGGVSPDPDASHAATLHGLGLRGVLGAAAHGGADHCPVKTPGPALAAGLQAYQGNAIALSARALAGAFPHLALLLGLQFASLAWAFWRQCPPVGGDLGTWGTALPAFLRETADEALAGVAAFEWALHEAERAADAVLDADSLNRLHGDPAELGLAFRPGLVLLALSPETIEALEGHRAWCTLSVFTPHEPSGRQAGGVQAAPHAPPTSSEAVEKAADQSVAEAQEKQGPLAVLVWRKDWRGQATQLRAAPAAFMRSALAGHSLEAALAVSTGLPDGGAPAPAEDPWDFTVFLHQALHEQWLTAVLPLDAAGGAKETHDVHLDESAAPPGRHGLPRRD